MENWGALDVLRDIRVELSRIRLLLSRETGDTAAFLDLKLKNEEDAESLDRAAKQRALLATTHGGRKW